MEAYRQQRRKPGPRQHSPGGSWKPGRIHGSRNGSREARPPGSLEANKGPAAAADTGSNQTSKQTIGRRQLEAWKDPRQQRSSREGRHRYRKHGSRNDKTKASNQTYNFRSIQTIEKSPGSDPKRDKKSSWKPGPDRRQLEAWKHSRKHGRKPAGGSWKPGRLKNCI